MTGSGNSAQPQRLLVATAVAHYPKAPQWDRPGLARARQQVIDLFTGALGYAHVSDLGLDPTEAQLTEEPPASICVSRRAFLAVSRTRWVRILKVLSIMHC